MRLWSSRRAEASASATDDLLIAEDRLRGSVHDVFAVHERQIRGGVIIFRGELLTDPARALDVLLARFRPLGYTPFVRRDATGAVIQAWPLAETLTPQRVGINVLLFLLTCLSTVVAGSGAFLSFDPLSEPHRLLTGVPFAVTL